MANVFCYSGAGGGGTGADWANAYTTLQAAVTAAGAGGVVYLADDHSETSAATVTITLPAGSNNSCVVISCDRDSATPSYAAATAVQLYADGAGNDLVWDGNGTFIGVYFQANDRFSPNVTAGELLRFVNCRFKFDQTARNFDWLTGLDGLTEFDKCVLELADTGSTSTAVIQCDQSEQSVIIRSMSFTGTLTYRTGSIIELPDNSNCFVYGTDFSGFTNASTLIARDANTQNWITVDGCKVASGVALFSTAVYSDLKGAMATRCDGNNYGLVHDGYFGKTEDEATVVRSSGAGSFSETYSWKVTTTAKCSIGLPYDTPWLLIPVTSTGSKTFTVYIANTSADLTDTECWLEVEYLGTSGSTVLSLATDRATDILSAGTAQTDDTSSTWGSSPTYMQSLAVTATVNKAGIARCRVGFAKASATVYVDPMVTVS